MMQRIIVRDDICCALQSATRATFQPKHGTWLIEGGCGVDEADGELKVAVAFDETTVVVTIYWEKDGDEDEDVR